MNGSVIPSFMTAATDGSVAFFTDGDGAALTSDTVVRQRSRTSTSTTSRAGRRPTSPADQSLAQVDGVLGASSDGSSVYFVAEGALASGATVGRGEPVRRAQRNDEVHRDPERRRRPRTGMVRPPRG